MYSSIFPLYSKRIVRIKEGCPYKYLEGWKFSCKGDYISHKVFLPTPALFFILIHESTEKFLT